MVTSGEILWSKSAGDIIRSALVELGAIGMGMEPEASEYNEAIDRLNGYLQELDLEGIRFREGSGVLTILAGVGGATLPEEIGEVSSARQIVSASNHRPLMEWNRSEYYSIPNRAQTGQTPLAYYIKNTNGGNEIVIWPVNSADISVHLDYQKPVEIVTSPDDNIDIPQRWYNCVMMNLASRCVSMFGVERLDPQKVARVDGRAAQLHQRLLDDDRPNSYIFEPYYNA